jgi:hypothetical protein
VSYACSRRSPKWRFVFVSEPDFVTVTVHNTRVTSAREGVEPRKNLPSASVVDETTGHESSDERMLHGSRRTNAVPSALAVAR